MCIGENEIFFKIEWVVCEFWKICAIFKVIFFAEETFDSIFFYHPKMAFLQIIIKNKREIMFGKLVTALFWSVPETMPLA